MKNRKYNWLILALAVLLVASLSFGQDQENFPDIYIDDDVGDGGVGSEVDPYNDLTDVNWTTGGDNSLFDYIAGAPSQSPFVHLETDDSWNDELTTGCSGTATYPIIIGKYGSGADPIISRAAAQCVRIASHSYITVQDISMNSWLARGVYATDANGIIIQRCTITGGNDVSPDHGIQFQGTASGLKTGVEIKDNTINTIASAAQEAVGFSGVILQDVDAAIISGNTFNTTNTTAIRLVLGTLDCTDVIIENNHIYGCRGNILSFNADRTIIRYNHIHDSVGAGIGVAYDSDNNQIYYNLIYDLTKGTVTWNGIDVNHDSQTGTVYSNTVYKVYAHCFVIDDATVACDGWIVKNNIFDATQNGADDVTYFALPWRLNGAGIAYTSDYNFLYPKTQTFDSGINLIVDTPSFESFTGTEDDGNSDTWTNWTNTVGGGTIEAVTVADADLASIPDGSIACGLKKLPAGVQAIEYQNLTLAAATEYTISYYAISDGTATGRIAIRDAGGNFLQDDLTSWSGVANWDVTGLSVGTGDTTWTQFSATFTSNGAGTYRVRYENITVNANSYIDDFECYKQVADPVFYDLDNVTFYTLAEHQSGNTQEVNSFASDPLMTDPANDDFTLQTTSPCVDAGTDVSLTEDYNSVSVPLRGDMGTNKALISIGGSLYIIPGTATEGSPDIGAYEYIAPYKFKDGHLYLRLSEKFYLRINQPGENQWLN